MEFPEKRNREAVLQPSLIEAGIHDGLLRQDTLNSGHASMSKVKQENLDRTATQLCNDQVQHDLTNRPSCTGTAR